MEAAEWSSFVVLSVILLVTLIVVLTRHAVPATTRAFHIALTPFMVMDAFTKGLLAATYRAETDIVLGLRIEWVRIVTNYSEIAWLSILLFYSYWHFVVRGRRQPQPRAGAETTGERRRGEA